MEQNPIYEYLRKNPYTWDTKQGFCHRLSLDEEEVADAIGSLVRSGFLIIRGTGERALYGPAFKRGASAAKDKWDAYRLTAREKEVARCILDGMLNQDIADALNVSNHTVKNHLTNMFKKLEVSDRAQAIVKLTKTYGNR